MTEPQQLRVIVLVPVLSPEPLRPTVAQVGQEELLAGFTPPEPDALRLPIGER